MLRQTHQSVEDNLSIILHLVVPIDERPNFSSHPPHESFRAKMLFQMVRHNNSLQSCQIVAPLSRQLKELDAVHHRHLVCFCYISVGDSEHVCEFCAGGLSGSHHGHALHCAVAGAGL